MLPTMLSLSLPFTKSAWFCVIQQSKGSINHFLFTGKAKGTLFEDAGDGYEFTKGGYLLTHYVAERHSIVIKVCERELQFSIVTVRVSETKGYWKRPKRRLHVQLLLGGGAKVQSFYITIEIG